MHVLAGMETAAVAGDRDREEEFVTLVQRVKDLEFHRHEISGRVY